MADIKDPRLLYAKAVLFLIAVLIACSAILLESPSLRTVLLLGAAVWAFCRVYYFLFHVAEKYMEPPHRYTGIGDSLRHACRERAGWRTRRE